MDKIRKFSHGVMFHHFYDKNHPNGQGAISEDQFSNMLDYLSREYNLLDADEYTFKTERKILTSKDICLTFDDALLCQKDIAAPILKNRNIKAYFFLYSSPFIGTPDLLEVYRYFRTTCFFNIDDFYELFFEKSLFLYKKLYREAQTIFKANDYLKDFPFYTKNDKWFRFLRDVTLGKKKYDEIMHLLMRDMLFKPSDVATKLWMNNRHILELQADGHIIGLHSYSHPTTIHLLDDAKQKNEYTRNYNHILKITGEKPFSMSHPCGNYNETILNFLSEIGIKIGFKSNVSHKFIESNLEIPREDHSNILREMI